MLREFTAISVWNFLTICRLYSLKLNEVITTSWAFCFSGFLFQTLPARILSFVLMTERGKERLQSPPFDKRKEVKM
ncbi:hypothetical protein CYK83_11275 [Clostridium perfringens]|nr:hypothetical protein CYK83_11275 [Clostridium perfringens]